MKFNNKKNAFTLSEIMITISLIGVLATLTLSTVGASVQQRARLAEFRTAFSKMDSTLKNIISDEGKIYSCYNTPTTSDKDSFGLSIKGNVSSKNSECVALTRTFARAMGATRTCESNPKTEGCVPTSNYPSGNDIAGSRPSGCFTSLFNNSSAYVLDNSMIIFTENSSNGLRSAAIDVNGRKGPNKWGQDIFPFSVKVTESTVSNGNTFVRNVGILPPNETGCTYARGAGRTTTRMMTDSAGVITR